MSDQSTVPDTNEEEPTTICVNCTNFLCAPSNESAKDIWYSHYCLAKQLIMKINPVNGQIEPYDEKNKEFQDTDNPPLAYCKHINHGNCPNFQHGTPSYTDFYYDDDSSDKRENHILKEFKLVKPIMVKWPIPDCKTM